MHQASAQAIPLVLAKVGLQSRLLLPKKKNVIVPALLASGHHSARNRDGVIYRNLRNCTYQTHPGMIGMIVSLDFPTLPVHEIYFLKREMGLLRSLFSKKNRSLARVRPRDNAPPALGRSRARSLSKPCLAPERTRANPHHLHTKFLCRALERTNHACVHHFESPLNQNWHEI